MKNDITAQDIANEIRMTRSQFNGSFLIVEGETADLRVYGRLVDREICQIIPAHGKENAVNSLSILDGEEFVGVLAIVDADFWRLDGKEPQTTNLFITDSHDLETMLLKSLALEKLLDEFGSKGKMDRCVQKKGLNIRQLLLDIGRPLGYFRWISQRDGHALTFAGVVYSKFVDRRTLSLHVPKMINTIKNKSGRHALDDNRLQNLINDAVDEKHNLWDVCSGHDLVRILSIGLCQVLGSNKQDNVNPEMLEKFLRTGYETIYFYTTDLYKSLKNWEQDNSPFRLFAE